ncbi:MAG: 2OG-Fe dioxygenase family protein [Acetobacter sp.]|nr:2OG-Fe dioxygenase family protein [Acetobacter sp.]
MTQISFSTTFSEQSVKCIRHVIEKPLYCEGFALIHAEVTRPMLAELALNSREKYEECCSRKSQKEIQWQKEWALFASSWHDLEIDHYMADGGRYRRRRYATFSLWAKGASLQHHQPHYQTLDYNPLNGGVERWFEPVRSEVVKSPVLRAIMQLVYHVITDLTPFSSSVLWHVEMHQFRIEAHLGQVGLPTPEGLHRDGVDWICVVMVRRKNITSGESAIYDLQHQCVGHFTLTNALDMVFINDHRVYHGVTPIEIVESHQSAYRDVLVLTVRKQVVF